MVLRRKKIRYKKKKSNLINYLFKLHLAKILQILDLEYKLIDQNYLKKKQLIQK